MLTRWTAAAMLAATIVSGCGAIVGGTIGLANQVDQSSTRKRIDALRAQQVEYIHSLQERGDPYGDYLFALANAEGWIGKDRISDPIKIRDMYQEAAMKGSSDAMIALGLMLFDGRGAPQYSRDVYLPREQQDIALGLEWVEKGMKIRCSYAQPVYDASATTSRQCVVLRSPASWIWPSFRDGRTRMNPDGTFIFTMEPNPTLQQYWRDKDAACRVSQEFVASKKACPY